MQGILRYGDNGDNRWANRFQHRYMADDYMGRSTLYWQQSPICQRLAIQILHGESYPLGNGVRRSNVPNVRRASMSQGKAALLSHQTDVQSSAAKTAAFSWKTTQLVGLKEF
jgi:hypothetical protein